VLPLALPFHGTHSWRPAGIGQTRYLPRPHYQNITRTRYFPYDCTPASRYSQPAMNGLQYVNAFVIQFRDDKDHSGRIEHVASGRRASFQSIQELPDLFERMLQELRRANDYES
jgi:hypothetical protein